MVLKFSLSRVVARCEPLRLAGGALAGAVQYLDKSRCASLTGPPDLVFLDRLYGVQTSEASLIAHFPNGDFNQEY
jgi:hypothetical protein